MDLEATIVCHAFTEGGRGADLEEAVRVSSDDRVHRRHDEVMQTQPVLVYDGDCAFCTTSATFLKRHLRLRCAITPWQCTDLASLGTTRQRAEYELLWITPTGAVHGGAQAVAKLLLHAGKGWACLGGMLTLPPLRWIAHGVYRLAANNRDRMPGSTPTCALPAERRPVSRPPE
ncbi:DUF393 domain-containing protein [Actinomadura vinacea]|uniref:thiol-disulfide oxidoreductase DCC family protein n=1 Tax=Actinomadura vinacea TaxID=115336 RepID=UPI0031D5C642